MDPDIQAHFAKNDPASLNRQRRGRNPMVNLVEIDRLAEERRKMNSAQQQQNRIEQEQEKKAAKAAKQSVNSSPSHPDIPGQTDADKALWDEQKAAAAPATQEIEKTEKPDEFDEPCLGEPETDDPAPGDVAGEAPAEDTEEPDGQPEEQPDDLENYTVAELKAEASDLEIEGRSDLKNKAELIEAIRKAR